VSHNHEPDYDVIVVGGGPGGAACSTFVGMQDHRVLLLEQSPVPSFKIGESLLPATIHGVCELLGVGEELKRAGFVVKTGGRFIWGQDREPWDFLFNASANVASPTATAYQVEREVFDGILLRNAAVKGVDVRFGHSAQEIVTGADGQARGLRYTDAAGALQTASARYIVDASGQRACFGDFVGKRLFSDFFRNMSIFRYYRGGGRLPEPFAGNVYSVAFEHGWFWHIPLRNGLTSVGAVFGAEMDRPSIGPDALFDHFVSQCPEICELLAGAERVNEGTYSPTRTKRDFSYTTSAFFKNGVVLVGDAACFLDPLFSSGVHLSTFSGLLAARSINTRLRGLSDDDECFVEYETRYRREFALFYDFLAAFYDVHRQHDSDFWRRRKVSASPDRWNAEYVDLLDGVDGFMDGSTGTRANFWTSRTELGSILFPNATGQTVETHAARRQRSRLLASLFGELTRLQLQAILRDRRPIETPIRQDGLIPSLDGLHWTKTGDAENTVAVV
jgi:halogenation protein CepH